MINKIKQFFLVKPQFVKVKKAEPEDIQNRQNLMYSKYGQKFKHHYIITPNNEIQSITKVEEFYDKAAYIINGEYILPYYNSTSLK